MKIIDNFFDLTTLSELKKDIQNQIDDKNSVIKKYDLVTEKDHVGLENSNYYFLNGRAKIIVLKHLITTKLLSADALNFNDIMLHYHVNRAPYNARWHLDGLYAKKDELDYIGITIFLNDDWNTNDGGLFVYKENKNDTQGKFIEPIGNRIIINYKDLNHAVTAITNKEVIRYSLQMFINTKYLI
jgi:hypothetical protein